MRLLEKIGGGEWSGFVRAYAQGPELRRWIGWQVEELKKRQPGHAVVIKERHFVKLIVAELRPDFVQTIGAHDARLHLLFNPIHLFLGGGDLLLRRLMQGFGSQYLHVGPHHQQQLGVAHGHAAFQRGFFQ